MIYYMTDGKINWKAAILTNLFQFDGNKPDNHNTTLTETSIVAALHMTSNKHMVNLFNQPWWDNSSNYFDFGVQDHHQHDNSYCTDNKQSQATLDHCQEEK